jgi:radical SAM protein with 4Fe4S-binding SPASM domain
MSFVGQLAEDDLAVLAFSGGEPLLSPHLFPVARKAHDAGMYVTVATNGTLLTPDMVSKLLDHGVEYVEISLDSVHPEKHNAFRGVDCWERVVQGVENAVADGRVKVGIAATLTSMNVAELEELIGLAKKLGVRAFNAFNFIPTGRGKGMKEKDLSPGKREEVLQILWRHLQEEKIEIMSTAPQLGRACLSYSPSNGNYMTGHAGYGAGEGARVIAKYVGGCGAGRCYLAVQPNGTVTPCVYIPLTIGSLREEKLRDIWHRSEICRMLRDRDLLASHCGHCRWRSYCGGCRARAYGYFGTLLGGDPGCINNLAQWEKLNGGKRERSVAVAFNPPGPILPA